MFPHRIESTEFHAYRSDNLTKKEYEKKEKKVQELLNNQQDRVLLEGGRFGYKVPLKPEITNFVLDQLKTYPGSAHVDLAGADGTYGHTLGLLSNSKVVVNDISELNQNQFHDKPANPNVSFDLGPSSSILARRPDLEGSASVVTHFNCMHFLSQPEVENVNAAASRLLGPNGFFIASGTSWNAQTQAGEYLAQRGHLDYKKRDTLFLRTYDYMGRDGKEMMGITEADLLPNNHTHIGKSSTIWASIKNQDKWKDFTIPHKVLHKAETLDSAISWINNTIKPNYQPVGQIRLEDSVMRIFTHETLERALSSHFKIESVVECDRTGHVTNDPKKGVEVIAICTKK